jgi:parvulin-like peptidyl-prolyl isomerase
VTAIVGPFRSGAGFHVLKVLEKSQAGAPVYITQNHARHILLTVGNGMTEAQAAKRLEDYKRRVESGQATFQQLAQEFSKDGSARNGGDLGWSSPGQFVPEFERVLDNLQPGQISNPVVSRFGVHLIQLIERRQEKLTEREQRNGAQRGARAQGRAGLRNLAQGTARQGLCGIPRATPISPFNPLEVPGNVIIAHGHRAPIPSGAQAPLSHS